jgi:hypothetical protein
MARPVFGTLIVPFSMKATRKCVSFIGVAPVFITTTSSQIEKQKTRENYMVIILYFLAIVFRLFHFPDFIVSY